MNSLKEICKCQSLFLFWHYNTWLQDFLKWHVPLSFCLNNNNFETGSVTSMNKTFTIYWNQRQFCYSSLVDHYGWTKKKLHCTDLNSKTYVYNLDSSSRVLSFFCAKSSDKVAKSARWVYYWWFLLLQLYYLEWCRMQLWLFCLVFGNVINQP